MLALSAANELMWHGIRVNLIEPGWTDTPGERTWYSDEAMYREGKKLPLGRLGSPEDIGHAAVYLASDAAAYVAGSVLTVDGGAFIQGPAWSGGESHGEEEVDRRAASKHAFAANRSRFASVAGVWYRTIHIRDIQHEYHINIWHTGKRRVSIPPCLRPASSGTRPRTERTRPSTGWRSRRRNWRSPILGVSSQRTSRIALRTTVLMLWLGRWGRALGAVHVSQERHQDIGAGYWRKGKRIYEQENQIHE